VAARSSRRPRLERAEAVGADEAVDGKAVRDLRHINTESLFGILAVIIACGFTPRIPCTIAG